MRKRKRNWILLVVMAAAALLVYAAVRLIAQTSPVSISSVDKINTIVIDAGHGGADGGAIGIGGVIEKNINLQIALKLRDILQINGYHVVMIRETDTSVHDSGKSIAQQKKSDMRHRLKTMNETPNSLTVSIHQNYFEQQQYSGAQMFYGRRNADSRLLADCIQKRFVNHLQGDNKREIKQAGRDLYLMYYAERPIVLVECGFLSNPIEAALLSDDAYQSKVAFTVFSGIVDYLQIG